MHSFSVLAAGEDEAVLEERAHVEEEKEDQALGRRQAALLGVGLGRNGTRQASRSCSRRRGRSSTARTLGSRRVGGMMMRRREAGGSSVHAGQDKPEAGSYEAAACRRCVLWWWRRKAVRRRTGARRLGLAVSDSRK